FWRLEIPSSTDDIIGYIHGKAVTFQGCFVAGSPFVIATSEMPLVDIHEISISSPAGSDSKLIRSACFPATAVLLTDYGAFLTVDGFKTSKEIKFPSTVLDAALAHSVKAVALSYSRITFLINDVLYIMKNGVFYKAEDSQFPRRGVQGVVSRIWCESEYPGDNFVLSDLLFWTEKEIYYQFPSSDTEDLTYMFMDTELLKRVMGFSDSANLIIINACYDSVPSEISILIACTGCSSSRKFYLVAYDEDSSVWLLRDFSLPAPPGAFFHMGVLYSAVSSMLLWDKDKVYYSYNKNKVNGYITVSDTHEILSASSERTTIHQVIIDSDGNTVIKMKNNAMFFLKFNMKDVIRLNDWEDENTKYILYLNPHHDLYFLTVNGSDIDREIYPLKIEVFSATYILNEVCPYISFQHSMELNIYYLDKGDNVTFWTQIVFLENLGLSTDIKTYRSDLLKRKTELQYEIARGICTKNETVTFYEDHDYSKDLNYNEALISSSGVFVVEMKPSTTGRRCITNQKLSFIKIGCSPFRHVGILTYENDEAISIVHSDYMLWEVNGREDFHYNSTMEQARCLQEAQNKALMIPESTENISRLEELWGPQKQRENCKHKSSSGCA
ncbi:Cation channel sperm-associated protein subunit epsilon, partial [Varanus komodoensis]